MLRDQGRRRLHILLAALSVPVVAGLLAVAMYTPLLAARHVRISIPGAPRSEVLRIAGLTGSPPMIDVNTGAVAARLDAVPGWGEARVQKDWPSTVRVSAVVRHPVAVVAVPGVRPGTPARWAEVDVTGRVLGDVATAPVDLPVLTGAGAPPPPGMWYPDTDGPSATPGGGAILVWQLRAPEDSASMPAGTGAALAVAAALPASVRSELLGIRLGTGGQLALSILPAGDTAPLTVLLGDGSLLGAKLTAVVTLLSQADLTGVTTIDATVPDRPVTLTAR